MIPRLGNTYGNLCVSEYDGEYYSCVENFDGCYWEEVPKYLYDALLKFKTEHENNNRRHR